MTSREHPLDANAIQIEFQIRWFGVLTIRGHLDSVKGTIEVPCGELAKAAVTVGVEASSIATGISLRDHHLRAERFLHADLHPWIRFTSTKIERAGGELAVAGLLSLRGVTTPIRATCPVDEIRRDGEQVELCARFVVSRSRHGVGVAPGILGYNPLLRAIADEVHVQVRMRVPDAVIDALDLPVQGARPRAATGHDDST